MNKVNRAIDIYSEEGTKGLLSETLRFFARKIEEDNDQRVEDIKQLLDKQNITVVDGGANRGQTICSFRDYFSSSKFYAFEPIPKCREKINQSYANDDEVEVYDYVLGSDNKTVEFNISTRSGQSSVLDSSGNIKKEDGIHAGKIKKQIKVEQRRLDELIDKKVDVLKLDLQGYELEALRGAEDILDDTSIILTEVQFVPIYENADLFYDVFGFLENKGFVLYNLYSLVCGLGRKECRRLEQGDAIFINSNNFDEFDC
jgi:FkbM family methyltransferase